MKKSLLVIALLAGFGFGASAQTPACTPDTTHFSSNVHVYPDSLPCISRSTAFSGVVSIQIPASEDAHNLYDTIPAGLATAYIDSVQIDSITGYPAGISSVSSPSLGTWIYPNRYACAIFSGTTTDVAGNYPLTIYGQGCGHFSIPGSPTVYARCISTTLSRFFPYSLQVCNAAGISEVLNGVNLAIYPNPNQGTFTVTLSTADRLTGDLMIMDELGRTIHTESVDVTGTKHISLDLGNIAAGSYLLVINTAGGKSVKQFVVSK
jgi:hypothetical protein